MVGIAPKTYNLTSFLEYRLPQCCFCDSARGFDFVQAQQVLNYRGHCTIDVIAFVACKNCNFIHLMLIQEMYYLTTPVPEYIFPETMIATR